MFGFQLGIEMLGRDDDLRHFHRLAVLVAHGDLRLGVGTELRLLPGFARIRHQLENGVAVLDGGRHEAIGLAAGIAEHDALIAGAFILVVLGIDALGDVGRLLVQQDFDVGVLPVKAFLLITDVANGKARRVDQDLLADLVGPARFAGDDHAVGGGKRFTGDAQIFRRPAIFGSQAEEGVHHLIGNAVADLVRMALRHGFAGKQIA